MELVHDRVLAVLHNATNIPVLVQFQQDMLLVQVHLNRQMAQHPTLKQLPAAEILPVRINRAR